MGGFAGELARDRPADAAAVERMAATMADRGSDGHGSWAQGLVALAHRRLEPAHVEALLAAPNERLTTLGGLKLWGPGLLELWLQEHGR